MTGRKSSRAATAPAGRGRNIRGQNECAWSAADCARARSPGRSRTACARPPTACARRCSTSSRMPMATRSTGARVLDLFAGTGALGIEAISRGAAYALFVDDGVEARALLRDNIETLGPRRRHPHFPPRRHQTGPGASARAVHARVPRPALSQRSGRKGAGVGARRRLAQARRAGGGRGSGGRRVQGAGGIRGTGAAHIRRYGICVFATLMLSLREGGDPYAVLSIGWDGSGSSLRSPGTTDYRLPNSRSISVSFNST